MAHKLSKDNLLYQLINKVDKITYGFIMSQVKNQSKKVQGQRFTLDDKILALSIYKQSPKAYTYLSTIFSLPCRKTIMGLLKNFLFLPGINQHIIDHIKNRVKHLNLMDRTYCLMFDEMSLQPELTYDKHVDSVFGFEDLGSNQRNFKLADHVLVFMVRGLGKKFKQPICYYYVQGTTKTVDLVQCIRQVVQSILTTGLNLVATLSDQGKTNVAAINILKRETSISFLKQGLENCSEGYIIGGHEVVHIYDPPHLLKCIRNNLLTKDVKFTLNNIEYTASWKFIHNLYFADKSNEDMGYGALPKLTEEHVVIEKMRKMKVSTAALTLSHRVASTLKLMSELGNLYIL